MNFGLPLHLTPNPEGDVWPRENETALLAEIGMGFFI